MANFDGVGLQHNGYTHTTPGIMSIGEHTSRRVRRGGGGRVRGAGGADPVLWEGADTQHRISREAN